jgi:16S rRNA C1402 (ribose-2'-O) methylase RsmI
VTAVEMAVLVVVEVVVLEDTRATVAMVKQTGITRHLLMTLPLVVVEVGEVELALLEWIHLLTAKRAVVVVVLGY